MLIAFLLIFSSSLFQALYNILLKKNTEITTVLLAQVFGGILSLPFLFFVKNDLKQLINIMHYVLFTGLCYGIYYWLLSKIYKKSADVSFVIPLQKAFGIISATIISFIIGFFTCSTVQITPLGFVGFGLIVISCFLLPLKSIREIKLSNYINSITLLCFIATFFAVISQYLDSASIKILQNMNNLEKSFMFAAPYKFALSIGMIPFLWFDDVKCGIKFTKEKPNYLHALIIGFSTTANYLLVFMAYAFVKDASYVIALRFMSIPMIMFGGFLVYKEKIYIGKSLGSIVMIIGLIITVFG